MDLCRTCMAPHPTNTIQFRSSNNLKLLNIIRLLAPIAENAEDKLPQKVCDKCLILLVTFKEFREMVLNNDRKLRDSEAVAHKENPITENPDVDNITAENTLVEKFSSFSDTSILDEELKSQINKEYNDESLIWNVDVNNENDSGVLNINHSTVNHFVNKFEESEKCTEGNVKQINESSYSEDIGKCRKPLVYSDSKKKFEEKTQLFPHNTLHLDQSPSKAKPPLENKYPHPQFHDDLNIYTKPPKLQIKPKPRGNKKREICLVCGKYFKSREDLKQHLECHFHKAYWCKKCLKRFNYLNVLKQHKKQCSKVMYVCSYCKENFNTPCELVSHKKIHA